MAAWLLEKYTGIVAAFPPQKKTLGGPSLARGTTGKKPRASWMHKFLDDRGKPSRNARREETQGTLRKIIRFLDARPYCMGI